MHIIGSIEQLFGTEWTRQPVRTGLVFFDIDFQHLLQCILIADLQTMPKKRHANLSIKYITQRFLLGIVINQIDIFTTGMKNILLCVKNFIKELSQIQRGSIQQIDLVVYVNLKNTQLRP